MQSSYFRSPNPRYMEIVLKAHLHIVNGTTQMKELPEFIGMRFKTRREKEKFQRSKLKEILGDKYEENLETDKTDIIFTTVTPPDGVEELPARFKVPVLEEL